MTATVLLFDGYRPGDSALEITHWIAERTRERLGEDAAMLTNPEAVRARLESQLDSPEIRGLAAFGHGDPGHLHATLRMQYRGPTRIRAVLGETSEAGAVYGSDDKPALDLGNLHLLRGRWCHALACNVGLSLGHRALEAGASCFVAYETSLTPEYETDSLPPGLRDRVAALATATTLSLHAGVREEIALKARVQEAIEELEVWLESEEGDAWIEGPSYMHVAGLRAFARQLKRDMVVQTAEREARPPTPD